MAGASGGGRRIFVFDDDPTGSQTVHSCLLLTDSRPETLRAGLEDEAGISFLLTNSRGLAPDAAAAVMRQSCANLKIALDQAGLDMPLLVSRSDSTLRGHFPLETDILAEAFGPFDATLLVPAFFEGGRVTVDGIHYVETDGKRVPAHETEFARDSAFGYSTAILADWVAEKTGGRVPAASVRRIGAADLAQDGGLAILMGLSGNAICTVDAEKQADLDAFAAAVWAARAMGKRLLFRSAASLLTSLAGLPPGPKPAELAAFARGRPGAVVVGSHVRRSSEQLAVLLQEPNCAAIEVDVDALVAAPDVTVAAIAVRAAAAFASGQVAVIHTSREERRFTDTETRLAFGAKVSAGLMAIIRALPPDLGFLVGKGGITSHDMLAEGLGLATARLLGQIAPGISVVRLPADHPRFPGLPAVIFPGNVGGPDTLAQVVRILGGG